MNAEYVAKTLENYTVIRDGETVTPLQEFADFVRQQQAKIKKSQDLIREYTALHMEQQSKIEKKKTIIKMMKGWIESYIPKELTDDEIVSLYESLEYKNATSNEKYDAIQFARAILRKAQEK
jgi:hypothetical protein